MSKSAPKPPDYAAAAREQAASSAEVTNMQTYANRPDQNTPFGSTSWDNKSEIDPATGQRVTRWEQNTRLTPESQRALDAQLGLTADRSELGASLMPRAQAEFGESIDWDKFQEGGAVPGTPEYERQELQRSLSTEGLQDVSSANKYYGDAEKAIYGKFASRADERFGKDAASLKSTLYAQGLREGDAAYDDEMKKFNQRKDDAYGQASYDATIGAGAEAQRYLGMDSNVRAQQFGERGAQGAFANNAAMQAFGQDLQRGGQQFSQQMQRSQYQTQLRQQQIAEEMQRRGFSLNEINAILTGQQVGMPSMPSFQNASRSEGMQSLSAAQMTGQAALDTFNAQQSGLNSAMGAAGGLASTAMMFSDRRLKKDIKELWVGARGLMLYAFRYVWEDASQPLHHGYMADEVEKLYPHAVVDVGSFKAVIYGSI